MQPNFGLSGHRDYRLLRMVLNGAVRRFEADLEDPRSAQERRLRAVLKAAKESQFAAQHGLANVRDLADFRKAVPLRTGGEYRPFLDAVAAGDRRMLTKEAPSMLLETSGTTGAPKLLPVTRGWAESVQMAQRLWTLALVRDHPGLGGGKALTVASPAEHGVSPGGIPIGSNTGRIRAKQPFWLRNRYAVPAGVVNVTDAFARQYATLRFGIGADVRSITAANPSLILLLIRRLEEWGDWLLEDVRNGTLRCGPAERIDPNLRRELERGLRPAKPPGSLEPNVLWSLESVNCWTNGPAAYFAKRLGSRLPGVSIRELGISASEGTMAFPVSADAPGSVLWVGGHVLEFALPNGDVLSPHELEEGMRARVVISTCAGLYRYDMADEIEVVGWCKNTPMVRFVGKSGRYLNAVGERVSEAQVAEAVAASTDALTGFTVRIEMGDVPSYVIAFEGKIDNEGLAFRFDESLRGLNVEYASKRASGRLGVVTAEPMQAGHYARWRAASVELGAPAGQLKDPIIAMNKAEWDSVRRGGE